MDSSAGISTGLPFLHKQNGWLATSHLHLLLSICSVFKTHYGIDWNLYDPPIKQPSTTIPLYLYLPPAQLAQLARIRPSSVAMGMTCRRPFGTLVCLVGMVSARLWCFPPRRPGKKHIANAPQPRALGSSLCFFGTGDRRQIHFYQSGVNWGPIRSLRPAVINHSKPLGESKGSEPH